MEKQKSPTQADLAGLCKCTPEHLNAVLCRRVQPSVKLAKRIERATGTPWQSWFTDAKEEEQP